jgi:serine protease Do
VVWQRLAIAVALVIALVAQGETLPVAWAAHPAVVRIIAPESGAVSFGSGSLVAVTDFYGLVVTNWHVVRDATGPLAVVFPCGFRSPARLLKTDRDWDLAALAIWRPPVPPLPVATEAPRPGQRLTIAGYGSGWYRTISGRCTQYVSPGGSNGFEMVELEAPARNGDSGGPIFNDRGEIAGVLFGSAFGRTTGSYCGRLRWFLSDVRDDFYSIPPPISRLYAQQPLPQNLPSHPSDPSHPSSPLHFSSPATTPMATLAAIPRENPARASVALGKAASPPPTASGPKGDRPIFTARKSGPSPSSPKGDSPIFSARKSGQSPGYFPAAIGRPKQTPSALQSQATPSPAATTLEADRWSDSLRNFLAVIGVVALLLQGLRLLVAHAS